MKTQERKRGIGLTMYLILVMIGNILLIFSSKIFEKQISNGALKNIAAIFYIVIGVLGIIFVIAIWNFKTWGVCGFVISIGIATLFELLNNFSINVLTKGMISMIITLIITIPVWALEYEE
ncbi:hypothetical protein [Tepidibacter formicigenes]|jgi:hypothetical protein|uniref:Uncharacterized protein n=1 Tax=Tepidibacter formicigenes DSM 15518 TaxID=1123349 RepID=A0A1M6NIL0_9FIRM|nr:hypothetical protein [Tepidibacter formicigenes]SHJ95486.1 hypothetical protein SAMN02744037_01273 [Tepidibacter formicigenes DSM 15518]